jgi:hypothetical protein
MRVTTRAPPPRATTRGEWALLRIAARVHSRQADSGRDPVQQRDAPCVFAVSVVGSSGGRAEGLPLG